jgi:hypothetical protein
MGIERGAAADPTGPLEFVGELPKPAPPGIAEQFMVAGFNPDARRMYVKQSGIGKPTILATYDLTSAVPQVIATRPFPSSTFISPVFTTTIAVPRQRAYTIETVDATLAVLASVDLAGQTPIKRWSIEQKLPGFFPTGLTYSAQDDRIYAVGEMSVTYNAINWGFGRKPTSVVPAVAAFDPDTGDALWLRLVPECGQLLFTLHMGSAVARSSSAVATPTIVFACGTGGAGAGDTFPGQAGVVELRITSRATMADAAAFDLHFHPISGSYFNGGQNGFAYYDRGSDRLFVQSLSNTTPGAWVFDLRLGGWAGFITGPTPNGTYGGINEGTGHYYMGGITNSDDPKHFMLVADGRASPPQSGQLADRKFIPAGFITADPTGDRVFINTATNKIVVARDVTKSVDGLGRPDYDAQTDDVDESVGTFVSFSGDSGGFGARLTAVGDVNAVLGPLPNIKPTSGTTRGLLFARVPTAAVQPSGAAASAQATSTDTTTGQAIDQNNVAWPYEPRTCLDGGGEAGEPDPAESVGGRAAVRCSLATYESLASARQSAVATGPVTIADSGVNSKAKRTAKGGMTTTVTSTSKGVRVDVPGVGSLDIASVESVATTTSHGRSGTASATWTRSLKGVSVKGAAGNELFRTDGCSTTITHDGTKRLVSGDGGTCEALAETVRRLLQVRVRLVFPTAGVVATPKGAFAGVGQTDTDAASEVTVNDQGKVFPGDATTRRAVPGLQINVYNDSTERSRYIVQLAGVETSSIYTVNRSGDDAPCDVGGCIPGGFDGLPPLPVSEGPSSSDASFEAAAAPDSGPVPVAVPSIESSAAPETPGGTSTRSARSGRGLDGLILARRSLADGGLMASFVLLVAAAAATSARRRRLLALLAAR